MKNNNLQTIILSLVITVFIIVLSAFFINSISVDTQGESLKIKGLYGTEIQYKDIIEIQELETIPFWGLKTNGINLGFMNIGIFRYKELGQVRLFEIKKEKPYILIIGKKEKIILGLGKEKNEEIYTKIKDKIEKNQEENRPTTALTL